MIEARLASTDSEIKAVRAAMPMFGTLNAKIIYGYWNKEKCIGGSFLSAEFPNNLTMEFYSHCPTVIKAIGQSFDEFLKFKPQINAEIGIANYKSLKIAKMLGFKKVYISKNNVMVQFNKQDWRYQKRYPLK